MDESENEEMENEEMVIEPTEPLKSLERLRGIRTTAKRNVIGEIEVSSLTSSRMCEMPFGSYGMDWMNLIPVVPTKEIDELSAVVEFRRLLEKRNDTASIPELAELTNAFILRFLRARKKNVESSYQLMLNYFTYRQNNAILFKDLNTDDHLVVNCMLEGFPLVLKSKDRKGRRVILFLMNEWNRRKYSLETAYRSIVLSMEYLLAEESNQLFGFVFVVDWTGFTLREYYDYSSKIMTLLFDGFQDSFPARVRNVHFIGTPWYMSGILALLKPFLKERMNEKLIFHGTNLSTLHEYIPADVASHELGGNGHVYQPYEWVRLLKKHEMRLNRQPKI